MTPQQFVDGLRSALSEFNWKETESICNRLIILLFSSQNEFPTKSAEEILMLLRRKRAFHLMARVGDAFLQSGRQTLTIRRQYAQALVDQGYFSAALCVLNQLIASTTEMIGAGDPVAVKEHGEAHGLTGRIYKQLYINANGPTNPMNVNYLKQAIQSYYTVFTTDPSKHLWHGINVAALVWRSKKDKVELPGFPEYPVLSEQIIKTIEAKEREQLVSLWDFPAAAEACIALNRIQEALEWISGYVRHPSVDAFELASFKRQLEEVWQLDINSENGKMILPLLRGELLKREGGTVTIDSAEIRNRDKSGVAVPAKKENPKGLEKVFGQDSYVSIKWYRKGEDRCVPVARIGRDSDKGLGTGFLVNGSHLHEKLGDAPVLLTNAHVISDDPNENALRSDEAVIIFESLDQGKEFRVGKILWSSPSSELDTTIIQFELQDQNTLRELAQEKQLQFYPIAPRLPLLKEDGTSTERIYVIGHPYGGVLQLSLHDNLLLDHQDPRMHYRTPTDGGNSGSPVFNQNWELIGIHHAGLKEMPKLNGKTGVYEANEGIWIQSIKKKLGVHAW